MRAKNVRMEIIVLNSRATLQLVNRDGWSKIMASTVYADELGRTKKDAIEEMYSLSDMLDKVFTHLEISADETITKDLADVAPAN